MRKAKYIFCLLLTMLVAAFTMPEAFAKGGGGGGHHGGNYHRPNYNHNNWNHHYHGNRCNSWNNNCRYYYGGYWYGNPWWIPVIGTGFMVTTTSNSSRHVAWCKSHYRSYNPKKNTWVSNSGKVKQCVSPYS